ncbi:transaldolase [Thalassoporum mexicanum PCC 7367]|uniref:transaldolase n=1 Tax=Thalassoporum mexicanum TaxID=3457544 RepID=UPI00029FED5B|nr:transaldolase [Pseudanabaena sp. PCC 7367]AFY71795.1 transaldolase [Pseudanabaena sp. PCC 7367]
MTTNHLLELRDHGQSVWLDNLSRSIIQSGELAEMIENQGIRGITSNPAIFQKAIAGNEVYDEAILAGIKAGKSANEIYESLAFKDIQDAADLLKPIYEASGGQDGYVSIEVSPKLARDTTGTIAEALRFSEAVDRPNVMIKIPGTAEGFPAIERVTAEGIPVNVTLLFAVEDYEKSAWAYIKGLESRVAQGKDISKVTSVASFFLSRIDVLVDQKLEDLLAQTSDEAEKTTINSLMGKVAIANAKIAYQTYKDIYASDRWQALLAKGANEQRLLWASTSTKNPTYSDVMYVDNLVGDHTVNTMPPETIAACIDHCDIEDRIEINVEQAEEVVATVQKLGIDLNQVMKQLEDEGIEKFIKPFDSLMGSLEEKMQQLTPA